MTAGAAGSLLDVLVIGGGQAGLAMGYHLAQSGRSFQIADAGLEIGGAWQSRWDSLRLFTSGRYDSLPGLPFPAGPDTYPGKDDVANYLQAYAAKYTLPVRLNTNVTSLTRGDDTYVAKAGGEVLEARQVVVATGPFQVPFIPPIADGLDPGVHQIHSAHYRRPGTLPAGKVLVVGAANSGCQIAQELSATHRVELSVGQRLPVIPQRPLGRDIWAWATGLRLDKVTANSRLGRRLAGRDQVIGPAHGSSPAATASGSGPAPRGRRGRTVTFADGSAADFDSVVWATGFRADHTWIDIPEVTDQRGRVRHQRGVTPSPGLYMLGLTWQHTRGSALLGWVGRDAAFLAGQITSR